MNTYKFCNVPRDFNNSVVIHCAHNDEVQHMGITLGENN